MCLENGLVGQGNTPEQSIDKLKQAIESFSEVYESESDIYVSPLAIHELHEFLTLEDAAASDTYELRKVYA
ncbi:MAG: type II toxin-antitoxin system HicB family antitoxin [Microcoleus sp. CSU_2_2]|nr:type II toxin-antitoxin system HicB family antitoxin [Microcoleus sp. SU_5_3]NJS10086.1 type II toxin-antitoxin system HicB family antitoxin [Microcoleus sp. CSU_2_2]